MKRFLLLPILLFLGCGCMDVTYVGQSFPPSGEAAPVLYFKDRSLLPPGKYGIIGRITATAPTSYEAYDFRERFLELARKHGADAVCLVSGKCITKQMFVENTGMLSGPTYAQEMNNQNLTSSGARAEVDSFGVSGSLQSTKGKVTRWEFKALLLMSKPKLEKLLRERGEKAALLPADPPKEEEKTKTAPSASATPSQTEKNKKTAVPASAAPSPKTDNTGSAAK